MKYKTKLGGKWDPTLLRFIVVGSHAVGIFRRS